MFYIGQKVICIDDSLNPFRDYRYKEKRPKKGIEYTVREITKTGIRLVEIKNKKHQYDNGFGEVVFKFKRFAPLETSSYSIAIELVQELQQVDKQKIFNPKKVEI